MSLSRPIRIALADDHPIVAAGVKQLLEIGGACQVVVVAHSSDQLFAALKETSCDIIVTDFSMPDSEMPDGLRMLKSLKRQWPDVPIIVLTRIDNPGILRMIRDSGIECLINKSDGLPELAKAVRAAMQGIRYLGRGASKSLMFDPSGTGPERPLLSPRESEVLRLLASGLSLAETANRLNRSYKTVSNQKLAAMAKLRLKTDLDIFAYCSEAGLL